MRKTQAELLAECSPEELALIFAPEAPDPLEGNGYDLRTLAVHVLCTAAYDAPRDCRAQSWLMSDGDDPGSFTWWCRVLGLDSATVRPRLQRLTADQIRRITGGQPGRWV